MKSDDVISAASAVATGASRPKRLIVIVIMNVALALFSIVALVFLLSSSKVPVEVVPSIWSAAFSAAGAGAET